MTENPLQTIGEKLRAAREKQNRSLDEIAAATFINRKFLEQIEQGVAPNLPPTYIRAFVRSYAQQVGLDSSELLQIDETITASDHDIPIESHSVAPDVSWESTGAPTKQVVRDRSPRSHQVRILLVLSLLLVGGLILSIAWLTRLRSPRSVQEISFDDVMKEHDKKDSAHQVMMTPVTQTDSLWLVGITSDTVWLRLTVDDGEAQDYMLKPQYRIGWKARKHFVVSIGNPGGISLALNGTNLGDMSKIRKPLSNVSITRDTLEKLAGVRPK